MYLEYPVCLCHLELFNVFLSYVISRAHVLSEHDLGNIHIYTKYILCSQERDVGGERTRMLLKHGSD